MSVYSLSDTISYVTQVKETLRKLFESILFIYQSICLLYSFGVLRCNIELEETVNRSLTMRLQRDSVKWENAVDDMTAAVRRMRLKFVCHAGLRPAVEQWISSLNTAVQHSLSENWNVSSMCYFFDYIINLLIRFLGNGISYTNKHVEQIVRWQTDWHLFRCS